MCTAKFVLTRRRACSLAYSEDDTGYVYPLICTALQVEYALQAAAMGGLTIGIQTDQGVVLAAQGKRRSPLLKSSSVSKIAEIDTRMSCAMSGLLPDGRLLIDFAR